MSQLVFRLINFVCSCGKQGDSFTQIGISSNYELVVRWQCPYCHKTAQTVTPLEDLVANAPTAEPEINATAFDAKFLKEAHVRLE